MSYLQQTINMIMTLARNLFASLEIINYC